MSFFTTASLVLCSPSCVFHQAPVLASSWLHPPKECPYEKAFQGLLVPKKANLFRTLILVTIGRKVAKVFTELYLRSLEDLSDFSPGVDRTGLCSVLFSFLLLWP
ncbi:hypothetical protein SRHO_G00126350 [Serrasalmus rhombeus]